MNDIYLPEEQQTPPAKRRLPKLGKKGRVLAITAAAAVLAAAVVPRVLNRGGGAAAIPYQLFYPQIGVGKRLDGGRRRVKKYLWSF